MLSFYHYVLKQILAEKVEKVKYNQETFTGLRQKGLLSVTRT